MALNVSQQFAVIAPQAERKKKAAGTDPGGRFFPEPSSGRYAWLFH